MPEEVEEVLRACAGVLDAKVYGKPSPVLGSIVVGEILVADNVVDLDGLKKELRDLCQRRLDAFKRPVIIRVVDEIQLTAAGKIRRKS